MFFRVTFTIEANNDKIFFAQEVIRLESQYWTLVDIPKQEKQETVPAFVLRACSIMEKTQKSGEGVKTAAKLAEEAEKRKELLERLSCKSTFRPRRRLKNAGLLHEKICSVGTISEHGKLHFSFFQT